MAFTILCIEHRTCKNEEVSNFTIKKSNPHIKPILYTLGIVRNHYQVAQL